MARPLGLKIKFKGFNQSFVFFVTSLGVIRGGVIHHRVELVKSIGGGVINFFDDRSAFVLNCCTEYLVNVGVSYANALARRPTAREGERVMERCTQFLGRLYVILVKFAEVHKLVLHNHLTGDCTLNTLACCVGLVAHGLC